MPDKKTPKSNQNNELLNSKKSLISIYQSPLEQESFALKIFESQLIAVLVADNDANYLHANKAAERLFGYSIAEFLLMNVRDLKIPEGTKLSSQYKNFVKTGKETGIFNFFNKNGEQKMAAYVAFNVEKDINVSLLTEITKEDFPNSVSKISEQLSSDIIEHLPCAVFRFTVDKHSGRFYSYVSNQLKSLFRLKRLPRLGVWKLSDLVVREQRDAFIESVNEAITERKPWRFIADYECGDGIIRRFEARSNPRIINGNITFEGIIFEVLTD
jgi:PAS domain S-box-containing protein